MKADAWEDWLLARVATSTGLPESELSVDAPFAELGLDSLSLVAISGEAQDWLPQTLDPATLWEFPTIALLSKHLASLCEAP